MDWWLEWVLLDFVDVNIVWFLVYVGLMYLEKLFWWVFVMLVYDNV